MGIEKQGQPDSKFQFNGGAEKVDDLNLSLYETTFRGYDPQLGRFQQIDPLSSLLPGITPYNYAYNNPVALNDFYGLCPECDDNVKNPQEGQTYTTKGGWGFTYTNGEWVGQGGSLPEVTVTPEEEAETVSQEGGSRAGNFMMGTLAVAAVTSQLDSPLPGPGDIVAGGEIIVGGTIALGILAYDALTKTPAIPITRTREKDEEYVTIYKAPQRGKGSKLLLEGFQKEDFPRNLPYEDGNAYFAGPNARKLAEEYARIYGEGVLQVTIPKQEYDVIFKRLERSYQGTPQKELPIPQEMFPVLNTFPRTLTPF